MFGRRSIRRRGPSKGGDGAATAEGGQSDEASELVFSSMREMARGRDFSGLDDLVVARGEPASRRKRQVALTFDDGPVLQTHDVLRTLESRGARGTFFLVGYKLPGFEGLVRRIAAGGHEIGNHTFAHSPFPAAADVLAGANVLERVAGRRPRVLRPPFGTIDRPAADATVAAGMDVVMWSVDSDDGSPLWDGIPATEVASRVLDRVRPGAIVLMHDGLPWSNAAEALPAIVDRLQADGYELVTVSELLGEKPGESGGPGPDSAAEGGAPPPLGDLLAGLGAMVGPVDDDLAAGLPARACSELAGGGIAGSELLAGQVRALETASILPVALGFSLRQVGPESEAGEQLPPDRSAVLRGADRIRAAGRLARAIAAPDRADRLVQARLAERAAGEGASVDPDDFGAGEEFIALFGPGREVWEEIQAWARTSCRRAAAIRLRELLDDAGVSDSFSLERVLEALDVDYLLRFGYVLGCCEEALALSGEQAGD